MHIIGRTEIVDLPGLKLENVAAKVDTGAYTSALHCSDVQVVEVRGRTLLRFALQVYEGEHLHERWFEVKDFKIKSVKNSFGHSENRFVIRTPIRLFGKRIRADFSLADRTLMRYPVLLGRKLLKKRFLVDVSQRNLSYEEKLCKQ